MSGNGASFSQITPLTPRVVGIDYIAVPKPGQYVPGAYYTYCPYLNNQPESISVDDGNPASFSVVADGSDLSYAWQVSTDSGLTWDFVTNGGGYSGANAASLLIAAASADMNGYRYRVILTQPGCPGVTSNSATLAVTNDIAAWWKMNAGSGSAIPDFSVNNNDGTARNAPSWVAGPHGTDSALQFNGSNQFVEHDGIPAGISLTGNFSACCWVKTSSGGGQLIYFGLDGVENGWLMRLDGGKIRVWFDHTYYTGATNINNGNWHHVAIVFDGVNARFYIDGVLDVVRVMSSATMAAPTAGGWWILAAYRDGLTDYLPGALQDFRIYSTVLSAADITAIYNGTLDPI